MRRHPCPATKGSVEGLWDDFWLNPVNLQTHGIRPKEIRELFPNCNFEFHKITLAPPLARKIVPLSWGLALFLEEMKIFNIIPFGDSHYLAIIRPLKTEDGRPTTDV